MEREIIAFPIHILSTIYGLPDRSVLRERVLGLGIRLGVKFLLSLGQPELLQNGNRQNLELQKIIAKGFS